MRQKCVEGLQIHSITTYIFTFQEVFKNNVFKNLKNENEIYNLETIQKLVKLKTKTSLQYEFYYFETRYSKISQVKVKTVPAGYVKTLK